MHLQGATRVTFVCSPTNHHLGCARARARVIGVTRRRCEPDAYRTRYRNLPSSSALAIAMRCDAMRSRASAANRRAATAASNDAKITLCVCETVCKRTASLPIAAKRANTHDCVELAAASESRDRFRLLFAGTVVEAQVSRRAVVRTKETMTRRASEQASKLDDDDDGQALLCSPPPSPLCMSVCLFVCLFVSTCSQVLYLTIIAAELGQPLLQICAYALRALALRACTHDDDDDVIAHAHNDTSAIRPLTCKHTHNLLTSTHTHTQELDSYS